MIVWTDQALAQLDQIHGYISPANNNRVADDDVVVRIISTVQQLARFPVSGRSGRIAGTRELVVPKTPFLVAYAIDGSRIVILAVYHGAQKWPDVL